MGSPNDSAATGAPAARADGRFELGGETFWVVSVPAGSGRNLHDLTPAEGEVCLGLLRGWSHRRIAAARGTSPRTVACQAAAIYRKLGIVSRSELTALLLDPGAAESRDG